MKKHKHPQYHADCCQNLLLELSVAFDEDGESRWPCPSTCQVGRVFQGCPRTRHCGCSVCLLLWAAAVLEGLQLGPGQGGTATVQGAPCGSLLALPGQGRAARDHGITQQYMVLAQVPEEPEKRERKPYFMCRAFLPSLCLTHF